MTTKTDAPSTDRITKRFEVRAPRSRVWRAITSAPEFSAWFGMKVEGEFAPGAVVYGMLGAGADKPGIRIDMHVARMEPEQYFSYRWHPYPMDQSIDYSSEPMTLVEFRLEEMAGGTVITITESGFDQIPVTRRAEAFRMNDGGWGSMTKKIEKYVS